MKTLSLFNRKAVPLDRVIEGLSLMGSDSPRHLDIALGDRPAIERWTNEGGAVR